MKKYSKKSHNPNRNEKVGRGTAMDNLGTPVQNDPVEYTTESPYIEKSQIDYGSVQFGQGANMIGGDNISSQLANLINVGINSAKTVVDIAREQQKRKDKEVEDNRLEQMRELMTNGVGGKAWVNMTDVEKLNAQQVINKRAMADTTMKSSRRPLEAEIFKNEMNAPNAKFEDITQKYQQKKNEITLGTYEFEWQRVDDLVKANKEFYASVSNHFSDNNDIMDKARSTVAGFFKEDRTSVDVQARRELAKNKEQIAYQINLMMAAELDGTSPVLDEVAFANNVLLASGYPQEFLDASNGAVLEAFDPIFKKYVADRRRNANVSLTEKISKQNIEIYNDTLTYLDNGTVGPGADRIKIADSRAALETRLDDPDMSELQRDTLVFEHFVAEMNHVANRSTLPEERNEEIGRAMASELLAIRGDSDKLKGKMDAFLSPDKVKPFGWSSIDRALEESKFEKLVDIIADDTAMNYNALGIVIERAAVQSVIRVNARVLAGMGLLTNKSKSDTAEGLTTRAMLNMVHTGNNWITAWEETTKDASTSGVGAALTQAQIDELGLKFFADPANDPWMTANAMRVGDVPTSEIALYIKDSINSDAPGSLTVDKNGDFVPYKEEIKVIESIAGLTGSTDDVAKVVADVKIPSPPTYGMMGPEGENWAIASIAKMIEIPGFATVINTSTPAQIAGIIKVALGASMEVKIGDSDSALAAAFALKNQLDKADVSTPDLAKAWLAEARKELAVPMQKLGSEVIQGQIFNATGYFSKQESMRDLDREKYVAQRDPNGEIDQGMTYALNNPEVFPTSFMYETRDMSLEEVVNAATEQGLKFEAELDTNDKITGGNFKIDPEWIKDKKETVAWSITSNTRAETGITMGDANVFVEKKTATSMRESAQRIAKNNSDDLTAQSTSRVLNLLAGPEKGGGPDLQAIRDLLRSKDEAEATDKMILKLLISGDTMEIPARKIIALTTIAEQNPAVLRELLKAPGKLSIFGGISRGVDKDPDGNWTVRMGKFSDDLFRSRANLTGFNGVRPGHIWADTVARNREMDEKEKTEVHNTLFDLGDIS